MFSSMRKVLSNWEKQVRGTDKKQVEEPVATVKTYVHNFAKYSLLDY